MHHNRLILESLSHSQMVGIGVPSAFILVHYFATGDRSDLVQALLGLSLAVLLTGIINDTIKVCVGRLVSSVLCSSI